MDGKEFIAKMRLLIEIVMPVVLKFITTPKVKIPEHPDITTIFYYRTCCACMSRIFRKQENNVGCRTLYPHT